MQRGDQIRTRVAEEVASVVREAKLDSDGLTGLAHAVIDAARAGIDQSVAGDKSAALREVAEGLGDGLGTAAEALRLTLQEAQGRGQRFAREDLESIAQDLQSLGGMFVSTFADATARVWGTAAEEARSVRAHVERTYQRIRPSVESALAAAREQPLVVGKSALQAGLAAGTHAAGALFSELGERLGRLGQRLQGGNQP